MDDLVARVEEMESYAIGDTPSPRPVEPSRAAEPRSVYDRTGFHDFGEIYQKFSGKIYRNVLKIVKDTGIAEDLMQETFIRVIRFIDQFEAGTNLQSWIYRISTNTAINYLRQHRRELQRVVEFEGVAYKLPTNEKNIQDKISLDEAVELVDKVVPEPFRTTLKLRALEDLSYAEIAQQQQIPKGTVMSRLHRAHQYLREYREGFLG